MKLNFFDQDIHDLREQMQSMKQKPFRADQLFRWVYSQNVFDFNQMLNISKDFRQHLPDFYDFSFLKLDTELISQDGTKKYLFKLDSGKTIETVLIPSEGRRTLCVSSEVGCNMACQFCYTGKQKLKQRLSAGEIINQFLQVKMRQPVDEPITNVVFMGMGEPLDNVEAVFKSVDVLQAATGFNLSRKKITISTSGLVPQIPLVTESGVRLAVSLNAADDETRNKIMPINRKWPIAELLDACRVHAAESKDLVTLEYVLLKDVTDSIEDAKKLYHLTKSVPCKLNIIPFNEHPGSGFYRPTDERVDKFQNTLMKLGAHVLRRRTMGRDIFAACGQLTSAHNSHPIRLTQSACT